MPTDERFATKDLIDVGALSTHRIQPKMSRLKAHSSIGVKPNIFGTFNIVTVPSTNISNCKKTYSNFFRSSVTDEPFSQKIKLVNKREKNFEKRSSTVKQPKTYETCMDNVRRDNVSKQQKKIKHELRREKLHHKQKDEETKNKHQETLGNSWRDTIFKQKKMKHELRREKLLQKQKDEEMKNKQRHEIYALNNVMKQLEHTHFKQFCDSVGIQQRDNTETNTATFHESILSQNLII
ncbi:uncharacterized protein LOC106882275 isoform X1 [Octopus bimaculoides]|uniref:Uncharacterized protein n=2 Tax=Octopus bimaculoides TaxID=37653 RepID=A0A0L8FN86_OCTBM|nr:uncharacterized protein LOC106882275 isoform X1 [Octopus bimaculoides]|eukprot:XP_014788379.1 PREDICTED: uncharacterized protein LOC106882275 isoform X1 [Octopus bimaculoides]